MKITDKLKGILIFLFCILTHVSNGQKAKDYTHNSLAEKIYLQIDNEAYTTNKTIWFKAIIINAATHNPNLTSGILYVDLIDSKTQIIASKIVKIKDGIGNGHFDLDRSYLKGAYLIRAYTEWNRNFESDFIFEKQLQIFSETEEDNIKVTSQKKDEDYNSSSQSTIISDTISQTSFSSRLEDTDVSFFPESGVLVDGLSSRVGFKAVDYRGKGKPIEGAIFNANNEIVVSFKSNELGMGSFKLDTPSITSNYNAKLKLNNGKFGKEIPLPKVQKNGHIISVSTIKDNIYVVAKSNNRLKSKISLKGLCRGYEYLNTDAYLIDGAYIYVIPKTIFPEGVIAFTLYNENKIPVAERLFFNERLDVRLDINVKTSKSSYSQRDLVDLNIEVKDNSKSISPYNLSVLVLDQNLQNSHSQQANILSYLLLSSDVRGVIEYPSFYFEEGNEKEIDHLLLTQGWRSYKYQKPLDKLKYKLEKKLNVSGVINLKKSKGEKETQELMLMMFDENRSIYTSEVEIPGRFNFELDDIYGTEKDLIIQPLNNSKKNKKKYLISINEKETLPVSFDFKTQNITKDSLITINVIKENRLHKKKQDVYNFNTYGTMVLDEVVVDGYKMTPQRKKVSERYGKPNVVIDGDKIREKETKFSTGLYSMLGVQDFMDHIIINRDSSGRLTAKTRKGGKGHITLFLVDGIPVAENAFDLLEFISVEEVTSLEIIDDAKQMKRLFSIVYSTVPPKGMLYGSIISIYTKGGKGIYGALKPSNKDVDLNSIKVFSLEKEFYTPQYESSSFYDASNPDLRLPIYWKPQLITNENRQSLLSFYHSDNIGDFQIIVEGISKTGEIGYTTVTYKVDENND